MTKLERIDYWKNCSYPRVGKGTYTGILVEFTDNTVGIVIEDNLWYCKGYETAWSMEYLNQ